MKSRFFCAMIVVAIGAAGCRNQNSVGSNVSENRSSTNSDFVGFTVKPDASAFLKMTTEESSAADNASCALEQNKQYKTENNAALNAGHYRVTITNEDFECAFRTGYVLAEHIEISLPKPTSLRFPFDRNMAICEEAGGGVGGFGAGRSGGARGHAGCDLYAEVGEAVRAMEDGTVVSAGSYYEATDIVDVESDSGRIISYGEVRAGSYARYGVTIGSRVKRGQVIAEVGRLSCCHSMLHLEMYSGAVKGSLASKYGGWYQRRGDLFNPTTLLKQARKDLLSGAEKRN